MRPGRDAYAGTQRHPGDQGQDAEKEERVAVADTGE